MEKIYIYSSSLLDDDEKLIFFNELGEEKVFFGEYKTKGINFGAVDITIIIDLVNNPYLTAALSLYSIYEIISKIVRAIFKRNGRKIMDDNTRPRYTQVVVRMETKMITISNVNPEGKITISRLSASVETDGNDEYLEEKLRNCLGVEK